MSGNGKVDVDVFGRTFRLKAVADIKQRDAVAWNRAYLTHGVRAAMADERQAALEAAIVAGWITEPATRWEDVTDESGKTERRFYFDGAVVDDMTPAEVSFYGLLCSKRFDEVMSIPKASSSA
jgi:hypothetical protein